MSWVGHVPVPRPDPSIFLPLSAALDFEPRTVVQVVHGSNPLPSPGGRSYRRGQSPMTQTAALPLPTDWRDFFALTKPRVISLVMFTGLCGLLAAPVAMMRMFAPRVEGHVLQGVGHWTQQERPDEVNRLLLDWLGRL